MINGSKLGRRIKASYSVLRFEASAYIYTVVGFIRAKLFFDKNKVNKLEFGLGHSPRKDGFITSDLSLKTDFPYDLRLGLPFPDNSLDFIYSEHCLEHFAIEDLLDLLHDCLRSLRPGGRVSFVVPNAQIFLEAYHHPATFDAKKYCGFKEYKLTYKSKIDYVNYMFYMDGHHRYMFDEANILELLKHAGFQDVRLRDFDPELDMEQRQQESIYVQATK